MAFTLEQIRNQIITSIHGRRLGLDKDGFLAGPKEIRTPVTNATSDTTGTVLLNHGVHTVATTTNDVWTLQDPVPGVCVRIATSTTSTGNHSIVPAAATIISSNGTAGSSITMTRHGAFIELTGISTAQWIVTSMSRSTDAALAVVSS